MKPTTKKKRLGSDALDWIGTSAPKETTEAEKISGNSKHSELEKKSQIYSARPGENSQVTRKFVSSSVPKTQQGLQPGWARVTFIMEMKSDRTLEALTKYLHYPNKYTAHKEALDLFFKKNEKHIEPALRLLEEIEKKYPPKKRT